MNQHVFVYLANRGGAAPGIGNLIGCVKQYPQHFTPDGVWTDQAVASFLTEVLRDYAGPAMSSLPAFAPSVQVVYPNIEGLPLTVEIWAFEADPDDEPPLRSILLATGQAMHCVASEMWHGFVVDRA